MKFHSFRFATGIALFILSIILFLFPGMALGEEARVLVLAIFMVGGLMLIGLSVESE